MSAQERPWTGGPWDWRVNLATRSVELHAGREYVMDFVRWGMQNAAPRFRRDGLMVRTIDLLAIVPGHAHHAGWWQTIDHPDARLIAAAPALYEALASMACTECCETIGVPAPGCMECGHARTALASARGDGEGESSG